MSNDFVGDSNKYHFIYIYIYAVTGLTKEEKKRLLQYQAADRYEKTKETEAIVNAKFQ